MEAVTKTGTEEEASRDHEEGVPSSESDSLIMVPVGQLLECTICLDVASSPINDCANGHIICTFCADKVKKCGMCENPEIGVSRLAERLVRFYEPKGKCHFYDNGCQDPVSYVCMKKHVETCDYRNVKCMSRHGACNLETPVALNLYHKHLMDVHKCREMENATAITFTLTEGQSQELSLKYIQYNGQHFLLNIFHKNDLAQYTSAVYWWVTVLGGRKDASEYNFETNLQQSANQPRWIKCSWCLPVLPFHDYQRFDVNKIRDYASANFGTLTNYFSSEVKNEDKKKRFCLEVKVGLNRPVFNVDVDPSAFTFASMASTSSSVPFSGVNLASRFKHVQLRKRNKEMPPPAANVFGITTSGSSGGGDQLTSSGFVFNPINA